MGRIYPPPLMRVMNFASGVFGVGFPSSIRSTTLLDPSCISFRLTTDHNRSSCFSAHDICAAAAYDAPESRQPRPSGRQTENQSLPGLLPRSKNGELWPRPLARSERHRTRRPCSSVSAFFWEFLFFKVTSSSRNSGGSASAHRRWGTISGSMSPLRAPLFSLLSTSNKRSLIIRTACVTAAAGGETLRGWGFRARPISVSLD